MSETPDETQGGTPDESPADSRGVEDQPHTDEGLDLARSIAREVKCRSTASSRSWLVWWR